ncbi:MAG: helix-turn-helix domain-containing protein [Providencia sp.]|uniref:helix-turn-helix domain-containing protein n=1 Tax=Providencia sp. TaxID=589 RepID=UPI003F988EFB
MKKNISKLVGLKIRALRESHGMSAKTLSLLLGISQQHQSRYENGDVNIHVDTIYHLSQIFNIDPVYFFTDLSTENKITNEAHCKKDYYAAEAIVF